MYLASHNVAVSKLPFSQVSPKSFWNDNSSHESVLADTWVLVITSDSDNAADAELATRIGTMYAARVQHLAVVTGIGNISTPEAAPSKSTAEEK